MEVYYSDAIQFFKLLLSQNSNSGRATKINFNDVSFDSSIRLSLHL